MEKVEIERDYLEGNYNIVIVWVRNGENLNRRKWRSKELVEFIYGWGGGVELIRLKEKSKGEKLKMILSFLFWVI